MAKVISSLTSGNVFKIEVKVGDALEPGTVVAILASMKMEISIEAEEYGRVTELFIREGEPIPGNYPILAYE